MREYFIGIIYAVAISFMSFYNMKYEVDQMKKLRYKDNRFC
jgi:hypothetical protein